MIDGPLLQKASTVVRATQLRPVTLDLRLLPELPNGFSGTIIDGTKLVNFGVQDIAVQYARDEPIVLDVVGCPLGTV